MLSLEKPPFEIQGVLLYADHADEKQFYYAPNTPRLSTGPNGDPTFDVTIYRNILEHNAVTGTQIPDQLGGGFLTLGVNCRYDEDLLEDVKKDLASTLGMDDEEDIHLAPIPLTDGRAVLMGMDISPVNEDGNGDDAAGPENQFIVSVLGTARPALLAGLKSIFSARLSEDGSRFMSGLMEKTGRLPIGVDYSYEFEGLMPGIDCKITAETSSLRKSLTGKAGINVVYVKAEIEAAIEKMERAGDVKIELISLQSGDEAEAAKERALSLFKERIIQDLFNPTSPQIDDATLQALRAATQNRGNNEDETAEAAENAMSAAQFSIGLSLKVEHVESNATLSYRFRESSPTKVLDARSAFLQSLLPDTIREDHITVIDLKTATTAFDNIKIEVLPPQEDDFERYSIERIMLDFKYGKDNPEVRSLRFDASDLANKTVAFARGDNNSIAYDLDITYEFDPAADVDADTFRYSVPLTEISNPIISLIPEESFNFTRIGFQHETFDIDVASLTMECTALNASDEVLGKHRVRFPNPTSEKEPEQHWNLRSMVDGVAKIEAEIHYDFNDGEVFTQTQEIEREPTYLIESPFTRRPLLIRANVVSDRVDLIDVEIRYTDEASNYSRNFIHSLSDFSASVEVAWPILNPELKEFEYRVTVHESGISRRGAWESHDNTNSLRVGSDVTAVDEVTMNLIGGSFATHEIEAVLVELEVHDENDRKVIETFLFEPEGSKKEVFNLIRKTEEVPEFRFRIQYFMASGDLKETEWETRSGATRLIIQLSKAKTLA